MKNNMLTIMKKELSRFFKDKRMVISTLLLPGLLIYVMYSFMGDGMMKSFSVDEDYKYSIYICNEPDSLKEVLKPLKAKNIDEDKTKDIKNKITDKDSDLLLVFPEDFDESVENYDSTAAESEAPNVEVYYNSAKTESQSIYSEAIAYLDSYESMLANKFDVNNGDTSYDLATKEDTVGQIFATLLPMLLIMLLFSGCMATAPESIAGEKERGTIATLLVTPINRSQLALGKILSLSILGLLSGISSFLGIMLSLPKMMGADTNGHDISVSVYGVKDYILLLVVILVTVLLIVSMISVVSAFAKSVKEAGTYISPLMIVSMVAALSVMFSDGVPTEFYNYLIPIYNSAQCMNGILSFAGNISGIIITIISNVVYSGILVFVLTKMFGNEKIMFSK